MITWGEYGFVWVWWGSLTHKKTDMIKVGTFHEEIDKVGTFSVTKS